MMGGQPYLLSTPEREAARELREALEACLSELMIFAHDGYDGVWLQSDFDDLEKPFRAAIRKARGEE
jgi:predicted TIM-barrel enzyme